MSVDGQPADVTLDGKGITAWGYTAGFMFNPTDKFRIGMNYRSEIIMEARDGDADFNQVQILLLQLQIYMMIKNSMQIYHCLLS